YFPRDTVSIGRPSKDGLAISARLPETSVDVSGDVANGALKLNGTAVKVRALESASSKSAKARPASVQLGSLMVPVDAKGRFAASVPQADNQPFDVSMVSTDGHASL